MLLQLQPCWPAPKSTTQSCTPRSTSPSQRLMKRCAPATPTCEHAEATHKRKSLCHHRRSRSWQDRYSRRAATTRICLCSGSCARNHSGAGTCWRRCCSLAGHATLCIVDVAKINRDYRAHADAERITFFDRGILDTLTHARVNGFRLPEEAYLQA